MPFKPAEEVLVDQTLRLSIRGREWVINPPSAQVGMALNMRLAAGVLIDAGAPLSDEDLAYADEQISIGDDALPDLARQCLDGPGASGEPTHVYQDMLDAGLTQTEVELAVQTAFLAWTAGRDVAETFWNSGGKASARRPKQAPRRTETPTPSGAESTTQKPASASGTPARRKARAAANKAARSRGSSPTTTTS